MLTLTCEVLFDLKKRRCELSSILRSNRKRTRSQDARHIQRYRGDKMTYQCISKIFPFETHGTPGTGNTFEGSCDSLNSLTPNFFNRQMPLQERKRTFEDNNSESLWNSTDLSTKGSIGFARGHLYFPAFKGSNRMTPDTLSTTQFFRMEANREFVKKFTDNKVSTPPFFEP